MKAKKTATISFSAYEQKLLETCYLIDEDFNDVIRREIAKFAVNYLHKKVNALTNGDETKDNVKKKETKKECKDVNENKSIATTNTEMRTQEMKMVEQVPDEAARLVVSKQENKKGEIQKFFNEDSMYKECKKKFHNRMLDYLISEQKEGKRPTLAEMLDAANVSRNVRNKNFLCEVGRFLKKIGVKRDRINVNNTTQTVYYLQ